MCLQAVRNFLLNYGVQQIFTDCQTHTRIDIANHVINLGLAPSNDFIRNHNLYKFHIANPDVPFKGYKPDDPTEIHNYLRGHSVRTGFSGKLVGLIYRIVEFIRGTIGKNDESVALRDIRSVLLQVHQLRKTPKPFEGDLEAKEMLEQMLKSYNSHVQLENFTQLSIQRTLRSAQSL